MKIGRKKHWLIFIKVQRYIWGRITLGETENMQSRLYIDEIRVKQIFRSLNAMLFPCRPSLASVRYPSKRMLLSLSEKTAAENQHCWKQLPLPQVSTRKAGQRTSVSLRGIRIPTCIIISLCSGVVIHRTVSSCALKLFTMLLQKSMIWALSTATAASHCTGSRMAKASSRWSATALPAAVFIFLMSRKRHFLLPASFPCFAAFMN